MISSLSGSRRPKPYSAALPVGIPFSPVSTSDSGILIQPIASIASSGGAISTTTFISSSETRGVSPWAFRTAAASPKVGLSESEGSSSPARSTSFIPRSKSSISASSRLTRRSYPFRISVKTTSSFSLSSSTRASRSSANVSGCCLSSGSSSWLATSRSRTSLASSLNPAESSSSRSSLIGSSLSVISSPFFLVSMVPVRQGREVLLFVGVVLGVGGRSGGSHRQRYPPGELLASVGERVASSGFGAEYLPRRFPHLREAPEVVSAALAELGVLAEARTAAPVAPIGLDGEQESHAPLSRLTGIGERVTRSGDPPLLDTGAPHCVHDADSQQMLAGPLGVVRMVRAIATRELGSGKERVQLMHLSLDSSLFTKALEEGSKVYEASEIFRGTA